MRTYKNLPQVQFLREDNSSLLARRFPDRKSYTVVPIVPGKITDEMDMLSRLPDIDLNEGAYDIDLNVSGISFDLNIE